MNSAIFRHVVLQGRVSRKLRQITWHYSQENSKLQSICHQNHKIHVLLIIQNTLMKSAYIVCKPGKNAGVLELTWQYKNG
jgi:hypothetical protein